MFGLSLRTLWVRTSSPSENVVEVRETSRGLAFGGGRFVFGLGEKEEDMPSEVQPIRQLTRTDRLRIRLGRCPSCRGRLTAVPQQDVESWYYQPGGIGRSYGRGGFGSKDGVMTGHNVNLRKRRIPHCPECGHLFYRGWIYPANANANASCS